MAGLRDVFEWDLLDKEWFLEDSIQHAAQEPTHPCPEPGCGRPVVRNVYSCPEHWSELRQAGAPWLWRALWSIDFPGAGAMARLYPEGNAYRPVNGPPAVNWLVP